MCPLAVLARVDCGNSWVLLLLSENFGKVDLRLLWIKYCTEGKSQRMKGTLGVLLPGPRGHLPDLQAELLLKSRVCSHTATSGQSLGSCTCPFGLLNSFGAVPAFTSVRRVTAVVTFLSLSACLFPGGCQAAPDPLWL